MTYLEIIGVAVTLFVILRFINRYLPSLALEKWVKKLLLKVFLLLELLLWVLFILWATGRLFHESEFSSVILEATAILFIALFGWYLLRDFISGAILKIENAFEPGQQIVTPLVCGRIKKLGYRSMQILSSKGEIVTIPYSLLSNGCITKPSDNPKRVEQILKLKLPAYQSADTLKESLKRRVLEMPWIVDPESVRIEISREQSENLTGITAYYIAEIHFHTINTGMVTKTLEILELEYGEKK